VEKLKFVGGVMGCASIAKKNIRALRSLEDLMKTSTGEIGISLVAIASRTKQKVDIFADECGLPGSVVRYGSYAELLEDKSVDAIYIPIITTLHLEWAVKTAEAKKSVLLDKPCAINSEDLRKIIDACNDNGVMFMDGVMFMHHDRLNQLRYTLKNNTFGGEVPMLYF